MNEDLSPNEEFIPQPSEPVQPAGHSATDSVPNPNLTPNPNPANSEQNYRDEFLAQMHQPTPKKKIGVGKIVAIVVAVLLIFGLVGFATWWFVYYSNPEVVVTDAVGKFISADNIVTNGTVVFSSENYDDTTNEISILYNNYANSDASRTEVLLTVQEVDANDEVVDQHSITITAGLIDAGDGTLYIRVDSIKEAFDQIKQEILEDDDGEAYIETIDQFLDSIDGEWWKISIEDVLEVIDYPYPEQAETISKLYYCAYNALATDYSEELKEFYSQNQFLLPSKALDREASTSGSSVYDVYLDYELLANFINDLTSGTMAESLVACYNDAASELGNNRASLSDIPEVDAVSIRDAFPDDFHFYVEISNFGHELRRVFFDNDINSIDSKIKFEFGFGYEDSSASFPTLETSAPEEYSTLFELKELIEELEAEMFSYGSYGDLDIDLDTDDGGDIDIEELYTNNDYMDI